MKAINDPLLTARTAAEASQELEDLRYAIAHDLQAPLRNIDGFSRALLEDCGGQLDSAGLRYTEHIRESALWMTRLLDGLLALSQLASTELARTTVNLSVLVRNCLQRQRLIEPTRAVQLVIPDNITALGDGQLLGLALEHLLQNAWKFTRKRDPARIEFGIRPGTSPLVYFVRDNGVGFDPRFTDKLYGVFQRLHSRQEYEGTGTGLAMVRRIAQRHGGRTWAEGAPDGGATFYFTLEEGPS